MKKQFEEEIKFLEEIKSRIYYFKSCRNTSDTVTSMIVDIDVKIRSLKMSLESLPKF